MPQPSQHPNTPHPPSPPAPSPSPSPHLFPQHARLKSHHHHTPNPSRLDRSRPRNLLHHHLRPRPPLATPLVPPRPATHLPRPRHHPPPHHLPPLQQDHCRPQSPHQDQPTTQPRQPHTRDQRIHPRLARRSLPRRTRTPMEQHPPRPQHPRTTNPQSQHPQNHPGTPHHHPQRRRSPYHPDHRAPDALRVTTNTNVFRLQSFHQGSSKPRTPHPRWSHISLTRNQACASWTPAQAKAARPSTSPPS